MIRAYRLAALGFATAGGVLVGIAGLLAWAAEEQEARKGRYGAIRD